MQKINARIVGFSGFPAVAEGVSDLLSSSFAEVNHPSFTVFPGFCDVHVHFREPGFSYKETIASGCAAAAHGGYTAVCTMPNLRPVPDGLPGWQCQQRLIDRDATVHVYPYAAITVGQQGEELSDMQQLVEHVIAFSDDGRGVQSEELMCRAMQMARSLGRMIVAHCEDNSLLHGGYIHAGEYARRHGHPGISSESEWRPIARDLELVRRTGCAYHVCHISCKESVALLRAAKAEGLDVSCETAPHYLLLDDSCLQEDGRFKMNPPLRSAADREALIEGLLDGTVDMIATDHAPHSQQEKAQGLAGSAFGIVGLESAFPLLYTGLVRPGILSLEALIDLMAIRPRRRFGIPLTQDFTAWALDAPDRVEPQHFLSQGRATPFEGASVMGRCQLTVCEGRAVYRRPPDTDG